MALRERISRFQNPAKAKAANPAKAGRGNAPKLAALAGLALATPRKKATATPEAPSFCQVDCLNFQRSTVAGLPPVLLCWQTEDNELWRPVRLDKMRRCPLPTRTAPPPAPPPPPTTGPEVPGLPCGGCGSTGYRRVVDGFIYPDGSRTDGWSCGSPDCGIKLLTGNKAVDRMARPEASR